MDGCKQLIQLLDEPRPRFMSSAVSKSLIHCDTSDGPLDKAGRAWLKSLLKEWVREEEDKVGAVATCAVPDMSTEKCT